MKIKITLQKYLDIRLLLPVVSKDPTRIDLNNLYYDAKEKRIVATDGHVLLWEQVDLGSKSFIFSPHAFEFSSKVIRDIHFNRLPESLCLSREKEFEIDLELIENIEYPNYEQTIPTAKPKPIDMVCVDFVLLSRLEKCLKKYGDMGADKAYTLVFLGEKGPIRIYKGEALAGIFMPCRMIDEPKLEVK